MPPPTVPALLAVDPVPVHPEDRKARKMLAISSVSLRLGLLLRPRSLALLRGRGSKIGLLDPVQRRHCAGFGALGEVGPEEVLERAAHVLAHLGTQGRQLVDLSHRR